MRSSHIQHLFCISITSLSVDIDYLLLMFFKLFWSRIKSNWDKFSRLSLNLLLPSSLFPTISIPIVSDSLIWAPSDTIGFCSAHEGGQWTSLSHDGLMLVGCQDRVAAVFLPYWKETLIPFDKISIQFESWVGCRRFHLHLQAEDMDADHRCRYRCRCRWRCWCRCWCRWSLKMKMYPKDHQADAGDLKISPQAVRLHPKHTLAKKFLDSRLLRGNVCSSSEALLWLFSQTSAVENCNNHHVGFSSWRVFF